MNDASQWLDHLDRKRKATIKVPAQGCSTCPYRRDTPPGIWSADEYERLRDYDKEIFDGGALGTFHCHQENITKVDTVCRGWLDTHQDSVAVRLAMAFGHIDHRDVPLTKDGETYYATGNEAADAGQSGVDDPSEAAMNAVDRLTARGDFNEG